MFSVLKVYLGNDAKMTDKGFQLDGHLPTSEHFICSIYLVTFLFLHFLKVMHTFKGIPSPTGFSGPGVA